MLPGGQFPEVLVGRVTILSFQQDAWLGAVVIHGENYHGTAMTYHVALDHQSVGFLDAI